ncbi:cytochrome P450 [Richelia sinica FACHB-800]|uniref:Cytochrome P450 n=1 Tax=Richelia sinica FACHB-800 TaxID=1357546 RepID=A0A975Y5K0_9NOST|nr:cytochrome P450 [Richelia sinica]MBD2665056.1 cytochrome P450 [Richelia sinica FACHB-800]QXE24297.1 cytochrome P450 [Richelia sinica FACHB-800]
MKNTNHQLPLPPGNFGLPFLGETIAFLRDPDFVTKRQKKYGNVFKTNLFGLPTIMMLGADANRFIFSQENQNFVIKWIDSALVLLGSASLVTQTGTTHQKRRKLLSQAFQPRALASYLPSMVEISNLYLQRWEKMGQLTWYPEIRNYTFDVACKLLVGTDVNNDTHFAELFEEWCNGLLTLPIRLPGTKFSKALKAREKLLAKIEDIIRQRQQQPSSGQDVLGLLLNAKDEDGSNLSIEELKDQLLTLLFAGHETLTSALTSFCLLLAQNPEILAAAREEQEQIGCEGELTSETLQKMTYLDQVLKEVLRFIPPVGGGFRSVIQTCEFNGYSIPQGWSVMYQVVTTHQDQSIYKNPETFDPQRFSVDRAEDKSKPFSYVTFGGGVRECLGKEFAKLEMKIFAALLLRGYEWELVPGQNLDITMIPLAHPCDGLKVYFRPRVQLPNELETSRI